MNSIDLYFKHVLMYRFIGVPKNNFIAFTLMYRSPVPTFPHTDIPTFPHAGNCFPTYRYRLFHILIATFPHTGTYFSTYWYLLSHIPVPTFPHTGIYFPMHRVSQNHVSTINSQFNVGRYWGINDVFYFLHLINIYLSTLSTSPNMLQVNNKCSNVPPHELCSTLFVISCKS